MAETVESTKALSATGRHGANATPFGWKCCAAGRRSPWTHRPSLTRRTARRKLGVWVRDSTAGVGTLTYIDPQIGAYGALGHAIVDADTGRLLDAREGAILRANIVGVTKGQSGRAGELKGNFLKEGRQIGSLLENCEYGIYGVMRRHAGEMLLYPQGLRVGARSAVHTGRGQHHCDGGRRRTRRNMAWRSSAASRRASRARRA